MTLVPSTSHAIDLPRSAYRPVKRRSRLSFFLYCVRHPIHWFMAYQASHPDEPDERAQTLFLVAIIHGVVAWMIGSTS